MVHIIIIVSVVILTLSGEGSVHCVTVCYMVIIWTEHSSIVPLQYPISYVVYDNERRVTFGTSEKRMGRN